LYILDFEGTLRGGVRLTSATLREFFTIAAATVGEGRGNHPFMGTYDMVKKKPTSKISSVKVTESSESGKECNWTFLSNHSHVIICLARDPEIRMKDVAALVGITERAVIRIATELEEAGYIKKKRIGRRNHYSIVVEKNLRHPLEAHHSIKAILALAKR
jgi:predicted transcriptional regulator